MKVLKKLVVNDYVELTNQQQKRILGGYGGGDAYGGGGEDTCKSTSFTQCSTGKCPNRWKPDSSAPNGLGKWVKQKCVRVVIPSNPPLALDMCGCKDE